MIQKSPPKVTEGILVGIQPFYLQQYFGQKKNKSCILITGTGTEFSHGGVQTEGFSPLQGQTGG